MKITFGTLFPIIIISTIASFINIVKGSEGEKTVADTTEESLSSTKDASKQIVTAEIHSSFSEEVEIEQILPPSQPTYDESSLSKNIQVASELSETADIVVFTLVDSASELNPDSRQDDVTKNQTNLPINSFEPPEELYIVRAEPKIQAQDKTNEVRETVVNQSEPVIKSSQEEPTKTVPQHEDIPSFREWTQKQLAEAEKKKVDQNATAEKSTKSSGKFRNKNYASPDCGAKIVAANPEAVSSSSVLSSSKDEYMLNYCTSRIWVIVELCEAIQAKQLDLANFELFSSSPKHFTVSIASRFPARDWSIVGKFTAKDSRDIQTFDLNPHLFGKYIKVELRSHYGKEHFCPVSWIGVFGTSEYEVLAKEDDRHNAQPDDDDDNDPEGGGSDDSLFVGQRGDGPKNLFSSATDAVLSIVKKATAPFMKVEHNETQSQDLETSASIELPRCMTPRFITVCDNCSQNFYDDTFFLLSCKHSTLSELITSPFVKRTLIDSESCAKYGLDFNSLRSGAPFPSKSKDPAKELSYLAAVLKGPYVAALCNVLAVSENKVVVNASVDVMQTLKNLTGKKESCDAAGSSIIVPSSTCTMDCRQTVSQKEFPSDREYSTSSHFTEVVHSHEFSNDQIKPTETLTEDEIKNLSPSETYVESTKDRSEVKPTSTPSAENAVPTVSVTTSQDDAKLEKIEAGTHKEEPKVTFVDKKSTEAVTEVNVEEPASILASQDSTLDSILSDLNEFEKAVKSNPASFTMPPPTNLPTESLFLRLANRIKNLEINMSISSSYLEEMSRRYRSQLEALSKTVNTTAQRVEEQYKLEEERERRREKEMTMMRMQLANLTRDLGVLLREKNSWRLRASSISQHVFFILLEITVIWIVFSFWKRPVEEKNEVKRPQVIKKISKKCKRRNSLEGAVGTESPHRRVRRPSEEALDIALAGNYIGQVMKIEKKKKRKKKDSKSSVNVIHAKRKKSEISNTSSDDPAHRACSEAVQEKTEGLEILNPTFLEMGELEMTNRFAPISSPLIKRSDPEIFVSGEPLRRFSSPAFMKTAMAARYSRLGSTQSERESSQESTTSVAFDQESTNFEERVLKQKKAPGSLKKYMKKFF